MAEIRVENLRKAFGDFVAVQEFELHQSTTASSSCLLGPSGCGKTTTLRMIAGLELPTSGQILLGGEDVTFKRASRARHRLRVPAVRALSAHERARRTSASRCVARACRAPRSRQRVEETARLLRIDHLLDQPVSGLAGGDRQRVALGRAIVRRPKAFLMDEPLGTLDAEFRELMCDELRELHDRIERDHGLCHPRPARGDGDGRQDRRHEPRRRSSSSARRRRSTTGRRRMFVADFIGSPPMNFLPFARRARRRARRELARRRRRRSPCRELREDAPPGELVLGVRPEHVRFDDASQLRGAGVRRRISRHDADRHGRRPRTARSRRALPADMRGQRRRARSASPSPRAAVAVRQGVAAGRSAPALHDGAPPWLTSRSSGVTKRFGAGHGGRATSTLDIADGEFVVLLGPTGAGKTTTLRLVAGLERPDARPVAHRRPRRRRGSRRPRATSPSCSSNIRSIRICRVFDNLAFPLRSPARRDAGAEQITQPGRARSPRCCASTHKLDNRATAAVRRRDAARRDRPGAGAPARHLPDGRAAVLARRQAARRPAARAEAHPAASSARPCSTSPTTRSRR